MTVLGNFIGFILLGLGVIWLGQDFGVIPGSFLHNEFDWGPRGPVSTVAGVVLLFIINFGGRRRT
jgi:hypothetical protein